jgi:hypothetical protein
MEAEEIEGVDAAGAGATIAMVVLGVKVFRFCMMLSKSLGKSPKRFDCSVLLTSLTTNYIISQDVIVCQGYHPPNPKTTTTNM